MTTWLQKGIYYEKEPELGKSCRILCLKRSMESTGVDVSNALSYLWKMYTELRNGVVDDIKELNYRRLHQGDLTVLIGYGPSIFTIPGILRSIPLNLKNVCFSTPIHKGGGEILSGSKVYYANDVHDNHALSDDVIIQIIAQSEFYTNRAVLETSKILSTKTKNAVQEDTLYLSRIYTGFQRDDRRNWFGFLDGVSNIPDRDRYRVIAVNNTGLTKADEWTAGGTYLSFLRIQLDMDTWNSLERTEQEMIIGRDKLTGCPLIGIDKNNKPVKDNRCPVKGTYEVIERGNEVFREHPSFDKQKYLPSRLSDSALRYSHVARANPSDQNRKPRIEERIFRQGYEFLEPLDHFPGFRVGLNFISYQNNPENLLRILRYNFTNRTVDQKPSYIKRQFEDFFAVRAAGIFFVPPLKKNEAFPGAGMFAREKSNNYQ